MKRIFLILMFYTSSLLSAVFTADEVNELKNHFFANFIPHGAIVASPSRHNPDYFYDWIRDSAIAMSLVEQWYEKTHQLELKTRLEEYVLWTEMVQHRQHPIPQQDILGEPKFYVDGYPYDKPWGRPQNDGPALRATVLIHFANHLLDHQEDVYVDQHLYHPSLDNTTMGTIKMDLEYIAHHWQDASFDLWEEIYGHHFFTAMAQKRALTEGAILAHRLHDSKAAVFYSTQVQLIDNHLKEYLDLEHETIRATLTPHSGPQKPLELDTAVLLAILLNPSTTGYFTPEHPLVTNTIQALHQQFNLMFPLNKNHKGAILFGRYPGDTYDGYRTDGEGNPWFILTAAMAEYYFTLAKNLPPTNKLLQHEYIRIGDHYLKLIKKYAPNLELSEQINLHSGVQQGAASLTWSYTAVLRALERRSELSE